MFRENRPDGNERGNKCIACTHILLVSTSLFPVQKKNQRSINDREDEASDMDNNGDMRAWDINQETRWAELSMRNQTACSTEGVTRVLHPLEGLTEDIRAHYPTSSPEWWNCTTLLLSHGEQGWTWRGWGTWSWTIDPAPTWIRSSFDLSWSVLGMKCVTQWTDKDKTAAYIGLSFISYWKR